MEVPCQMTYRVEDASPLLDWFGTLVSISISVWFIRRSDRGRGIS